jgi:hypothetical protein
MGSDPDGAAILRKSAALLKAETPTQFTAATDADFDVYRRFFRQGHFRE